MNKGVVIYSGQQYQVFGGGQTMTQLARAFVRRGYEVLFVPLTMWARHGGYTGAPPEPGVTEVPLSTSWDAVERFVGEHGECLWLCGLPTVAALDHLRALQGRCPTVYHIRDDWAAFREDWWRPSVEAAMATEVDVVAAITPQYQGFAGRQVVVVPNAYDPEVFQFRARLRLPERPTVVYWGSYSKLFWRDDIFHGVVRALPEWRFRLVGGYAEYWSAEGLPGNVELVGWRPLDELSAIAEQSDLGIIPFGTAVSERCDPVKAHEMCGAGLPIVACGCPAVAILGVPEAIHVEPDVAQVVRALHDIVARRVDTERQRRYAATDTWDDRVVRFEEVSGIRERDAMNLGGL